MKKCFQVVVVLLALQISAAACNVPVFRYALERWPVEPYTAIVIANDPLTPDEQRAMEQLTNTSEGGAGALNLMVRQWTSKQLATSSFAKTVPESKKKGARLHVILPASARAKAPFWSGALSMAAVKKIKDSPARKALIKKILGGDSGVFVLLESGDEKKDAEAAKAVEAHVAALAANARLPDGIVSANGEVSGDGPASSDPTDQLKSKIPFKVAFSSMRIAFSEDEEVLTALLLNLPNSRTVSREEPMVFTVYGRARVIEPLIGLEEISSDLISRIASFLTGACSCQVKAQNPGTDLLLDHDWDRSVLGGE